MQVIKKKQENPEEDDIQSKTTALSKTMKEAYQQSLDKYRQIKLTSGRRRYNSIVYGDNKLNQTENFENRSLIDHTGSQGLF